MDDIIASNYSGETEPFRTSGIFDTLAILRSGCVVLMIYLHCWGSDCELGIATFHFAAMSDDALDAHAFFGLLSVASASTAACSAAFFAAFVSEGDMCRGASSGIFGIDEGHGAGLTKCGMFGRGRLCGEEWSRCLWSLT